MNDLPEVHGTLNQVMVEILTTASDLLGLGLVEMGILMYVGIGIGAILRLVRDPGNARTY